MICLDTHVWLWWVTGHRLPPPAVQRRAAREPPAISMISIWEVAHLAEEGRFRLDRDIRQFLEEALAWEDLSVIPITSAIAIRASRFGPLFPKDPVDRLVTATAVVAGAALATADEQIRSSGVVQVLWD